MPFNKLNHSHLGEIRPRFRLNTDLSIEDSIEQLKVALESDPSVLGRIEKDHAHFKIPEADRHYWSPELQVSFDDWHEDGDGTLVRCLVGPQPTTWTLFAFFYIVIGLATTFGGFFGLTQLYLGNPAYWLWSIPAGGIILPTIYITSKFGQKKGRDQMLHLISFLYHALDKNGTVERI